ncbi:Reticulon-like protein B11 [Nymphaea thermarum]|nr:Reticulon-like protein B11 [Nymphaea thermarum]
MMMAENDSSPSSSEKLNPKKNVHRFLGGGQVADILLWKRRNVSISIVAGATAFWWLFDRAGYSFLSFVANVLLLLVSILFFWAKSATLLNRPLPPLPDLKLSEDQVAQAAESTRLYINDVLAIAHDLTIKKDVKVFLEVFIGLWIVSYIGSFFSFPTVVYVGIIISFTIPALYEKYQDRVDERLSATQNVVVKQYRNVHGAVLSRIPSSARKEKKTQ